MLYPLSYEGRGPRVVEKVVENPLTESTCELRWSLPVGGASRLETIESGCGLVGLIRSGRGQGWAGPEVGSHLSGRGESAAALVTEHR